MSRWRIGLAGGVLLILTVLVPLVSGAGRASAAPDPTVEAGCTAGTLSGTTYTLTANCSTAVPLSVPAGQTINGGGFTITATGNGFGAVLSNETAGESMSIMNLTIKGQLTGSSTCPQLGAPAPSCLVGILFANASGSVSGVHVTGITLHSGAQVGFGIQVTNATIATPVNITGTTVSDYQKGGLIAQGSSATVNLSNSTVGPPDDIPAIAQNGIQYGGATTGGSGTISNNTIYGSGSPATASGTAVLLFSSGAVTVKSNTLTGAGTDLGVALEGTTTGTVISDNHIARTAPNPQQPGSGIGVFVRTPASEVATLTCNDFSGWNADILGTTQALCITVGLTPNNEPPTGTVGAPYSFQLTAGGGDLPFTWSLAGGSLPAGLSLDSSGLIQGTPTISGAFHFTARVTDSSGTAVTADLSITVTSPAQGYWLTTGAGQVFPFGAATSHGSTAGLNLVSPVVGMATTPAGAGYWLAASDGGVFSFGNAPYMGSMGGIRLNKPVVGMAATPDGRGYYLVASDGGVFTFGDARFMGSTGNIRLNQPVVGMAVTPDGGGYYLVASDGGVFAFGDARFQGSTGSIHLNQPVVGMALNQKTSGYWLVASDGGIFSFGAPFFGSTGNIRLNKPIVGMAALADGSGYRFVASDGGVFCFGDAPFLGSLGATPPTPSVVDMASIG